MTRYVYDDFKLIPHGNNARDVLWELIDGIFHMSPPPSTVHQELSGNLFLALGNYLKQENKQCKIFTEPTNVYLDDNTVVRPDIFIICDVDRIRLGECIGIPDLIVEILSPNTKNKDLPGGDKFNLYRKYGLKEYWIVDPLSQLPTT